MWGRQENYVDSEHNVVSIYGICFCILWACFVVFSLGTSHPVSTGFISDTKRQEKLYGESKVFAGVRENQTYQKMIIELEQAA